MNTFYFNGEHLEKLRLEKNLSQAALARSIGVQRNTICQYEKGTRTPSLGVAVKLADKLNTSLDYLVHFRKREMLCLDGIDYIYKAVLRDMIPTLTQSKSSPNSLSPSQQEIIAFFDDQSKKL